MERKIGLTDAKIAGIKPPQTGQFEIPDQIVPGLRLRVGASGHDEAEGTLKANSGAFRRGLGLQNLSDGT